MISGDWAQGIADVRKRRAIVNFSQQNIYPINKTVSKLISTDSRGHLLVVLCLPQGWAEDVESGLQVTENACQERARSNTDTTVHIQARLLPVLPYHS